MPKVYVKKKQITVVKHTIDWFINRIEQQVFHRVCINDVYIRKYIKIETPAQARSMYINQNINKVRYFQ